MSGGAKIFNLGEPAMKADQGDVSAAVVTAREAARSKDAEAAEMTLRMGRRLGPEAMKFLRHALVTEGFTTPVQRIRAALAILDVGRYLSGNTAGEIGAVGPFQEPEDCGGPANGSDHSAGEVGA